MKSFSFLKSQFFLASALKVFTGVLSVCLFPFWTILLGTDVASEFAILLSQTMVFSVLSRLGADQFFSQLVVTEGRLAGRPARFFFRIALFNIFFSPILVLFELISFESCVLAFSISFATMVGRICIGVGQGIQSIATTNLYPLLSYYFAAILLVFGLIGVDKTPFVIAFLMSINSVVALARVANIRTDPIETKAILVNLPYFSLITIVRSIRNQSPVLLAAFFGFSDVWLLGTVQRAVNFFGTLQVVVNSVFFRHAFVERGTRKVDNWLLIFWGWLAALLIVSSTVALYSPETVINITIVDALLCVLAGLFGALTLKYGNIGIKLIHIGKVRILALILLFSYVLAVLVCLLLQPLAIVLGQVWITTIFAASSFLATFIMDKMNVDQN